MHISGSVSEQYCCFNVDGNNLVNIDGGLHRATLRPWTVVTVYHLEASPKHGAITAQLWKATVAEDPFGPEVLYTYVLLQPGSRSCNYQAGQAAKTFNKLAYTVVVSNAGLNVGRSGSVAWRHLRLIMRES